MSCITQKWTVSAGVLLLLMASDTACSKHKPTAQPMTSAPVSPLHPQEHHPRAQAKVVQPPQPKKTQAKLHDEFMEAIAGSELKPAPEEAVELGQWEATDTASTRLNTQLKKALKGARKE